MGLAFLKKPEDHTPQNSENLRPYADPGDVERAERHTASWRRAFFVVLAVLVIIGIGLVVLGTSRRTEAIVYTRDDHGGLTLVGIINPDFANTVPADDVKPSIYAVEKTLAEWVENKRAIPDGDTQLTNKIADQVFTLIAPSSTAYQNQVQDYKAANPVALNKIGIHRSAYDVQVQQITSTSYSANWKEHVYVNGEKQECNGSMTITLAMEPRAPTDLNVARINPNGVLILNYDGTWNDNFNQ